VPIFQDETTDNFKSHEKQLYDIQSECGKINRFLESAPTVLFWFKQLFSVKSQDVSRNLTENYFEN